MPVLSRAGIEKTYLLFVLKGHLPSPITNFSYLHRGSCCVSDDEHYAANTFSIGSSVEAEENFFFKRHERKMRGNKPETLAACPAYLFQAKSLPTLSGIRPRSHVCMTGPKKPNSRTSPTPEHTCSVLLLTSASSFSKQC